MTKQERQNRNRGCLGNQCLSKEFSSTQGATPRKRLSSIRTTAHAPRMKCCLTTLRALWYFSRSQTGPLLRRLFENSYTHMAMSGPGC
jgi:hypothetical protein